MTGLDASRDRVVEICVERVMGGRRTGFLCTLLDPGERVGGAAHVHGIDAAKVSGAPRFESVARDVRELLDGATLVAHAAAWDVRFLAEEFRRAGAAFDVV